MRVLIIIICILLNKVLFDQEKQDVSNTHKEDENDKYEQTLVWPFSACNIGHIYFNSALPGVKRCRRGGYDQNGLVGKSSPAG
mgnify:CR=1 FL=1